ncbi:NAD(P)H-dependent oxidoreductase [Methanoregula sp.]|jgi:multimeric flavodoxin WrbA|uniref:NAD(P)H-dependent oxidoreductase n=1 Tax=Methanoregula sp. TaxID=2052170 RepID=UPI0035650209
MNTDGFIFGSPVHFAAASGAMTSFMDRLCFTGLQAVRHSFYLKPAAAVVYTRRAGTTATFDQRFPFATDHIQGCFDQASCT